MLPGLRLVKIDRQLTGEVLNSKSGQACVAGLAAMARVAGIHSVAKKVDREDEHALLAALGVDFVQGYGAATPAPLDAIDAERADGPVDRSVRRGLTEPAPVRAFAVVARIVCSANHGLRHAGPLPGGARWRSTRVLSAQPNEFIAIWQKLQAGEVTGTPVALFRLRQAAMPARRVARNGPGNAADTQCMTGTPPRDALTVGGFSFGLRIAAAQARNWRRSMSQGEQRRSGRWLVRIAAALAVGAARWTRRRPRS